METIFHLKDHNTSPGNELRAGFTTFFAMAYIIFLNPVFLSAAGMEGNAVLAATCLGAAAGSILCGLVSNTPFALAPGMGLNAFFAYTLCGAYGYSWRQALAFTLLSGLLFLAVAASPLRDRIIDAVPGNLRHAICAGIGFFIALIGLIDCGLISFETGVPALGDLSAPGVRIALIGLAVTLVLTIRRVPGGLVIGMLLTILISILTGGTALPGQVVGSPAAISGVFLGMSFEGLGQGAAGFAAAIRIVTVTLSMAMVDMFDTLGFLIGAGSRADMIREDGRMPWAGKVLVCDAAATVLGALFGTSTVTCYAESAAGMEAGGRTGLTPVVTGLCFLIAMFFSPLAGVVTSSATAPALIVVGIFMMLDLGKIRFDAMEDTIPVFLTVIAMPMAYSITTGIAVGFLSHVICKTAAGRFREIGGSTLALSAVFLLYFLL